MEITKRKRPKKDRAVSDVAETKKLQQKRKNLEIIHGALNKKFEYDADADIVLVEASTGEEVLRVQKEILCELSPYFCAMLSSGMAEANQGCLNLDWPGTVTYSLVEFLYTGFTRVHVSALTQLAMAADELLLPALATAIRLAYRQHLLTCESVIYWYTVSQHTENTTLLQECLALMCTHTTEVFSAMKFPSMQVLLDFLAQPYICLSSTKEFLEHLVVNWADGDEGLLAVGQETISGLHAVFASTIVLEELLSLNLVVSPGIWNAQCTPYMVSRVLAGPATALEDISLALQEEELGILPPDSQPHRYGIITQASWKQALHHFLCTISSFKPSKESVLLAVLIEHDRVLPFPQKTLESMLDRHGASMNEFATKWLQEAKKRPGLEYLKDIGTNGYAIRAALKILPTVLADLEKLFACFAKTCLVQWALAFPSPSLPLAEIVFQSSPLVFDVKTSILWLPAPSAEIMQCLLQLQFAQDAPLTTSPPTVLLT
eukprot:TRINITY_DN11788_c0_g1_i1.p1 TRINITY_DN11788_c0_g1~~TRINITY_DN11788_c0_g1_i1.p1  ORF type:complete len:490 (+),score=76.98 TRINITY_DN11788_c0_g1_i1:28-1497(+)